MKKLLSMLLCLLLLCVSGAALAEGAAQPSAPAFDLTDLTMTVGETAYAFPMSIEDCKAAGIVVPEFKPLSAGRCYPALRVEDAANKFQIRVDLVGEEYWATGCTISAENTPDAAIGGFTFGDLTRQDVENLLGTPYSASSDYVLYKTFGGNIYRYFYFDGEGMNAKLNKIEAYTTILARFGIVEPKADDPEAIIPDASGLTAEEFILDDVLYSKGITVQTLLDNGWMLTPQSADVKVQAVNGWLVYGHNDYVYNGEGLVFIGAYNYTDSEIALTECKFNEITVHDTYKTSLLLCGGITFGCTLAEVEAVFGAASESKETDGGTVYTFQPVEEGITYKLTFADDVLYKISIGNLK